MQKAIYFDMDGTIANLYGVKDWLPKLRAEDASPYADAESLINMRSLARMLNTRQKRGYKIGIVSWLSKTGTTDYDEKVIIAKRKWLQTHLKSVRFDEIHIVKYGTPKQEVVNFPKGLLFDDELKNRKNWLGVAYDEKEILETLKILI